MLMMTSNGSILAVGGIVLVLLILFVRFKLLRSNSQVSVEPAYEKFQEENSQLVHRLCPHSNVVQSYAIEQKDSLDEHLDVLTKKLAEKEGRLLRSKSKIRETQHEIDNLHAIDNDVRIRYQDIMESLRGDLLSNEKECKKLQDQIAWVSQRRAELREEVRRGQQLYGEAAAELVNNLAELQRHRRGKGVVEKPINFSETSLRHRKEPRMPHSPVDSFIHKHQIPTMETLRHRHFMESHCHRENKLSEQ